MARGARLFGHPIHQMLIVFPLGLLATAVVFDVLQLITDNDAFATASYYMIAAGILSGLLAAVFGAIDYLAIPTGTRAFKTALTHMALNLTVVALFAVGLALRHGELDDPDGTSVGLLVLSAVALAVLGVSGWLGGVLTYRYGVRVVDEATQGDAYEHAAPRRVT